jgi:hypothetical protein
VGVVISALGLGLAVFGILKSSQWGWVEPRGALTIGGREITPFGFSMVPFFILAGLGCLAGFAIWARALLRPARLSTGHARAGRLRDRRPRLTPRDPGVLIAIPPD